MAWAVNRPVAGTAYSLPTRLFPADNWWNLAVASAPLDIRSAALINFCAGGAPALGGDPALDFGLSTDWGNNYGLPYCTVSGDYPLVYFDHISYSGLASGDDARGYPIPVDALTVPGWTEDLLGTIDTPVSIGDRHLLIFDVDNQYLYEIYQPRHNATASPITVNPGDPDYEFVLLPGEYSCASCSWWDTKTNNVRPEDVTSSDAAGLQVLPGLVNYDEIISGAPIYHAHRLCLFSNSSDTPKHVWPATHDAGSWTANHPPLGTRFRLKSTYNASAEHAVVQTFIQSLKDYGLIFADRGGHGQMTGTNDTRWGTINDYPRVQFIDAISRIDFADLEVIELGWAPASSQRAVPTSLITADWTGTFASLSDGSDGTYLTSPITTDEAKTFVCDLEPLTDPGVDTGHAIAVRAMIDTLGAESLMLTLRVENVSDGSIVATKPYGPIADTFINLSLPLTAVEAALILDYGALRLRGWWAEGNTAFVWDAYAGANSYVLQVGTSPGLSDRYNANVGNFLTHTLALAPGTYYARRLAYAGATLLHTSAEQTRSVT